MACGHAYMTHEQTNKYARFPYKCIHVCICDYMRICWCTGPRTHTRTNRCTDVRVLAPTAGKPPSVLTHIPMQISKHTGGNVRAEIQFPVLPIFWQFVHFSKEDPGPFNGFFLEVVAEAPVPEHFKESVVVLVLPHVVQVVVLAPSADTFLGIYDAPEFAFADRWKQGNRGTSSNKCLLLLLLLLPRASLKAAADLRFGM